MFNFLMKRCFNNFNSKKLLGFIISSMFLFNFILADACEMDTNSIQLQDDGAVWYNVDTDIAGFQWTVDGANVLSASGGDAAAAGFTVQGAGTTVLGFSFTGSTISAGCGTLTTLSLSGDATGLSGIVFSDSTGSPFEVTYYTGADECASGVYDCAGVCDGTAVED